MSEVGFRHITSMSKGAQCVFASLVTSGPDANAWYGKGAYGSSKGPDDFHADFVLHPERFAEHGILTTADVIIDNNFRRMAQRDGFQRYLNRVQYCVPLLVASENAYNVLERCTPEMEQAGHGPGRNIRGDDLNEVGKPQRNQWVVRMENEGEVGHARVNLMEVLRTRADQGGVAEQVQLAFALGHRAYWKDSEAMFKTCLDTLTVTKGKEHSDTLECQELLADMLFSNLDRRDEARRLASCCLEARTRIQGEAHHATLNVMNSLADMLSLDGRYDEASRYYSRCFDARKFCLQSFDLATAAKPSIIQVSPLYDLLITAQCWAGVREQMGELADAAELYQMALDIKIKTLGPEDPETMETERHLSRLLQSLGRQEEAEPLLDHQEMFDSESLTVSDELAISQLEEMFKSPDFQLG